MKGCRSSHCSYSPNHKQCVVGDENGEDKTRSGVYYRKRIDDDPFPEEPETVPFPESCEDDLAACEQDKSSLATQLNTCQANARGCGLSFNSAECKSKPPGKLQSALISARIGLVAHIRYIERHEMYAGRLSAKYPTPKLPAS